MTPVSAAGIDRKSGFRRRDRDQPGAGPCRGAGGEPGGAGHHRAAATSACPRVYLWLSGPGHGNSAATSPDDWPRRAARPHRAPRPGCRSAQPRSRRTIPAPAAADGRACGGKTSRSAAARGAMPRTSPLAPSTPLGTSTATTGIRLGSSAAMTSRATPSTGRASPAPKIASITRPAPQAAARERLDRAGPAPGRDRGVAAQAPLVRRAARPAPASRARPTAAPRQSRRRHCCPARTAPPPAAATSAATPHRRRRGRHSPSARCRAPRRRSSAGRPRPFRPAPAAHVAATRCSGLRVTG